jgi:hypothetical protein
MYLLCVHFLHSFCIFADILSSLSHFSCRKVGYRFVNSSLSCGYRRIDLADISRVFEELHSCNLTPFV